MRIRTVQSGEWDRLAAVVRGPTNDGCARNGRRSVPQARGDIPPLRGVVKPAFRPETP